jgi:vacuolar protein sorting-associated protein 13A/C
MISLLFNCFQVLGPINSTAQLRLNPKPEYDGSDYKIPKVRLSLEMEKLSVGKFHYL